MTRWATVGILMVFAVGVIVGIASVSAQDNRYGPRDAIAADTDSERIEALEAQVQQLANTVSLMSAQQLPGPDPDGYWVANAYIYDRAYSFDLLCTIGEMRTDYMLKCTQPQPMVP